MYLLFVSSDHAKWPGGSFGCCAAHDC